MLTAVAIVLAVLVLPSPWGAAAVAAAAVVDLAETAFLLRRSRARRSVVGSEALVGREAIVTARLSPTGYVRIDGETWAAACEEEGAIDPGRQVEIVRVDRLLLVVRPARLT